MFEAYKIGIKLSLVNGVSSGLRVVSSDFAKTHREAVVLQKKLDAMKMSFKQGAYLFGTGATIAAPFVMAISKAAELQKQLIGIQLATRGTDRDMTSLRKTIEGTAATTIFSNIDVAKMAKIISTGTGFNAKQLQEQLPTYARFADVQMLMKGTSYEESTKLAVRMAHTAQHYDPESLTKYMDLLTKASMIIPGSLSEIGRALSYSQGIAKTALGINDNDMVVMTALLNRMGFAGHGGSRAGTNLIAALGRTIPGVFGSGLFKGKSAEALAAMGMTDGKGHSNLFENGKFSMFKWIGHLTSYVQREYARNPEAIARQNIVKNFKWAFGEQGGRVASMFSSPQALMQLNQIGKTFNDMGGVDMMQKKFADESVAQKWVNLKTNFTSALTEIGFTLLPMATVWLTKFNKGLQVAIPWLTENQTLVKNIAYGFLTLAGALMFGGTLKVLKGGFQGLSIVLRLLTGKSAGVNLVKTAFSHLNVVLGGQGGLLGTLIAMIPVAYELSKAFPQGGQKLFDWTHNKDGSTNSMLTYMFDHAIGLNTKMRWLPETHPTVGAPVSDFRRAWGNQGSVSLGVRNKHLTVTVPVSIGDRVVAKAVANVMSGDMERSVLGTSGFDQRQSPLPSTY